LGDSGTDIISSGDYKYLDMTLGKNAVLTISGNVRLYLTNSSTALNAEKDVQISLTSGSSLAVYTDGVLDFSKDATLNNTTADPTKFVIYSTYSSSTGNGVSFSKNGSFYGAIYCPDSGVSINKGGDIYGAIVGKTVTMDKDQNIHYDEALTSISGGSGYTASNWQEL